MGIILIALLAGVIVYATFRGLGALFFRDHKITIEPMEKTNKYIENHTKLLEEEREYLEYLMWCKKNGQPYTLDQQDNELKRKVREKYKDILYPEPDLSFKKSALN